MGEAKRKLDRLRPGMTELLPPMMRHLPVDKRGFPVPWFVAWFNEAKTRELEIGEGTPDFRIIGSDRIEQCIRRGRCWVCGNVITSLPAACVIGPMCSINRVSAEPPSHLDCARFSAVACPFLSQPKMRRNEKGMENFEDTVPGIMIERNPGVTLVWITEQVSYNIHSRLFNVGEPVGVEWYAHGRRATRAEVLASIESGLPALREVCDRDKDPAASHAELDKRAAAITELLPQG
jgi:hypothetical protein